MYTVTTKNLSGETIWLINDRPPLGAECDAYWSYKMPESAKECFGTIEQINEMLNNRGFISQVYAYVPEDSEFTYLEMLFKVETKEVTF